MNFALHCVVLSLSRSLSKYCTEHNGDVIQVSQVIDRMLFGIEVHAEWLEKEEEKRMEKNRFF